SDGAFAQGVTDRCQGGDEAARGFVENDGARLGANGGEEGTTFSAGAGWEAFEDEASGGRPGDGEGADGGCGPRNGHHRHAGVDGRPDQLPTGVAHARHPRVADERNALAREQLGYEGSGLGTAAVLVIGRQGGVDVEVTEQFPGDARVL